MPKRKVEEELWETIPGFSKYKVSNMGEIWSMRSFTMLKVNPNNYGHMKILLTDDNGVLCTRSVALIVAQCFCEKPFPACDFVMVLDGDYSNVAASNLVWRPRWFAWKYSRQLKLQQPLHYCNLPVANMTTGVVYESIIHAGTTEGLLFEDIWESTYMGTMVYPFKSRWKVVS